jgi:hypothetical protein
MTGDVPGRSRKGANGKREKHGKQNVFHGIGTTTVKDETNNHTDKGMANSHPKTTLTGFHEQRYISSHREDYKTSFRQASRPYDWDTEMVGIDV